MKGGEGIVTNEKIVVTLEKKILVAHDVRLKKDWMKEKTNRGIDKAKS